jgi:hypothetical protein
MMRTWAPGLSFFALGFLFSQWQVRWPFWAALPLFVSLIFIAPLNHGCTFSFTQTCGNPQYGPFGVQMFAGNYGFLPLFFLSSLIGSLTVVCLSAGFARLSASDLLAYMGRKSLELFFINGFVATFLRDYFWEMDWGQLTPLHYLGLFIGIVAAHLLALQVRDFDCELSDARFDRRNADRAIEGGLATKLDSEAGRQAPPKPHPLLLSAQLGFASFSPSLGLCH